MLRRFSEALQTAADILAPPATRLEEFKYHWNLVLHYYQFYNEAQQKQHVEDTSIPHHLHEMLRLIVEEEEEHKEGTIGPCFELVVNRSVCLLDGLTVLAMGDHPPGARVLALNTATQLLRRTKQPCIDSLSVHKPLMRLLLLCNESPASPTEKEEVELLLTLCGLVRKEPGLANIFTTPFFGDKSSLLVIPEDTKELMPVHPNIQPPKGNKLFENVMPPVKHVSIVLSNAREDCNNTAANSMCEEENVSRLSQKTICDNEKFLLIDLLLTYLDSADNLVVLRACEGIMIVASLPVEDIANLVTGCSPACETIMGQLATRFRAIPASVRPTDVEHLNITWTNVAHDLGDKFKFPGHKELISYFSWLDYCDTLAKECHPAIATHMGLMFRECLLEGAVEASVGDLHHAALATAVLGRSVKTVESLHLLNEISAWLAGCGVLREWPLLHTLVERCLSGSVELTLETLRFFETIIEKSSVMNQYVIHRLVLCRLCARGYLAADSPAAPAPDDERDRLNDVPLWRERESNREAMRQLQHEDAVSGHISDVLAREGAAPHDSASADIYRVINSFVLLLPRAILSDPLGADYEHYIHDAHRNYQLWLDMTSHFNWPSDSWAGTATSSTHSFDSRPEADHHITDGPYAPPLHTPDGTYAPPNHTPDGPYASTNHTPDGPYAPPHHIPNGPYAPPHHTPDGPYAPPHHTPNGPYAPPHHTPDGPYAPPHHTSNGPYAPLHHTPNGPFAPPHHTPDGPYAPPHCCISQDNNTPEKHCSQIRTENCNECFSQKLVLRSRDLSTSSIEEEFDEGPFFRMLFKLLVNMPNQPYHINLHLTSIILKLALMPHPNLHEYLLNPMLPTAPSTRTLFKCLQEVAKKLTMEIPRIKNYKQVIENTRLQLMSDDPSYDESGDHNTLVESLVVLEEFCKELAAVAFVKHQHANAHR